MKLGILKADSVLADLSPRFGEYRDMFARLLQSADPALVLETWDVEHAPPPPSPSVCDGWLITGSRHSVYDDLPWIAPLTAFVQDVVRERRKLVGVCFGHQLVADALGGRTAPADRGWTVGVQDAAVAAPFPWADPATRSMRLIHSHKDQVVTLPPGAELVGGNDACPNGLYRIGQHVMTCQGHPEFSADYARALYERRRDVLGQPTFDAAMASLDQPDDSPTLARWIIEFLRAPAF